MATCVILVREGLERATGYPNEYIYKIYGKYAQGMIINRHVGRLASGHYKCYFRYQHHRLWRNNKNTNEWIKKMRYIYIREYYSAYNQEVSGNFLVAMWDCEVYYLL